MLRHFEKTIAVLLCIITFSVSPSMEGYLSSAVADEDIRTKARAIVEKTQKMDVDDEFVICCLQDGSLQATIDEHIAYVRNDPYARSALAWDYDKEHRATAEEKERALQNFKSCYERLRQSKDYVAVSSRSAEYALLKKDGTVELSQRAAEKYQGLYPTKTYQGYPYAVYSAENPTGKYYENWRNIASVAYGHSSILALRGDGRVEYLTSSGMATSYAYAQGTPPETWEDIVAIANDEIAIGIKSDGTVNFWVNQFVGPYYAYDLLLEDWTDIVQVVTYNKHVIGLKKDGTVVGAGDYKSGQLDVENWTDIIQIATGQCHTVGLRKDGTVVATGCTSSSDCCRYKDRIDVSGLKNVGTIYANDAYTVAVTRNGRIEIVGGEGFPGCELIDNIIRAIENW